MPRPRRAAIIVAFAALYLIWGSTYLAILFAIRSIPPLLMAGSRFVLAGLLLYSFAARRAPNRFRPMEWRTALIVGACLLLCGNGGVTLAEQYVPSGLAALLVATVPIYITLLNWIFGLSDRPTGITIAGLAGGFAGVAVLVGPALRISSNNAPSQAWIGVVILLCSSLIWSAGSLYSRYAHAAASTYLAAAQQMLCGGALLLLAGFAGGELHQLNFSRITIQSLGSFAYLVLIGGIIGYVSYAWLLRHCDPAKVATYAYVNPIVAVFLGTIFAGEKLTLRMLLGAALIVSSVATVIMAQQMQARARAPVPQVSQPVSCT